MTTIAFLQIRHPLISKVFLEICYLLMHWSFEIWTELFGRWVDFHTVRRWECIILDENLLFETVDAIFNSKFHDLARNEAEGILESENEDFSLRSQFSLNRFWEHFGVRVNAQTLTLLLYGNHFYAYHLPRVLGQRDLGQIVSDPLSLQDMFVRKDLMFRLCLTDLPTIALHVCSWW